jgi:hypothetical protein
MPSTNDETTLGTRLASLVVAKRTLWRCDRDQKPSRARSLRDARIQRYIRPC